MTDLGRLLDEKYDERIISAINDLDFQQFQDLVVDLLKRIGVIVASKEELGDAVMFRGEGAEGRYLVMASRLFDHASPANIRRVKALAVSEGRSPVLILTNDLEPEAKAYAEKEGVSFADKKKLLLLLRKYKLADALIQEIDRRVLEAEGERVLPSAGRFDHHMVTAIEHMGKGRFKDAIYSLDRALELKPSSDQVWQARANALFNLGRLEEALESCKRATELRPTDRSSWYLMGLILGQMEDFEGEVKAYDTVLRLDPGNRSALLNKGTAFYRMGKFEKALKVYEQMLKLYHDDVMAYNNLGIVLKAMGRTDEALSAFQRAAALDRGYINPIINMGLVHTEKGEHELAIEAWKRALQLERRRADILMSMGASYRALGDLDSALNAYRAALEIDPGSKEAKAQEEELLSLLGAHELSVAESKDVVAVEGNAQLPNVMEEPLPPTKVEHPGKLVSRERCEDIAVVNGAGLPSEIKGEKALAEPAKELQMTVKEGRSEVVAIETPGKLAEAETSRPPEVIEGPSSPAMVPLTMGPVRTHELTVKMLMMTGDLSKAVAEADRALAEHPGESSIMRVRAKALAISGRHDAALAQLTELYAKEKDESLLYDIEAISYLFGQRKEGAQILSRVRPTRESVARELIDLLETGRLEELMVRASKAGRSASGLSMQAQALGLMKSGRYRDAAKIWKDILGEFPANAEALNGLGACMRFMGEYGYEEPIKFMMLATLIDPMYSDAYNNVGCAYFAAGAYDQALEHFNKAISIDRRPEYYLNMSSVQLALGDIEGAKASLTSALKLEESPEVLFMLAVIAEREGDLKWAARLYEDAIAIKPDFKDAMFNLQRIKLQLKYQK
ncbi:MAG: tetratricopeptide repeat protein [Methanomassiliicoccales archaeon]|nr:MAG: tetratricopeptide repeat protein [Methanomassiliicoccales archaeon]